MTSNGGTPQRLYLMQLTTAVVPGPAQPLEMRLDLVEREQVKLAVFHHDGRQWKSLRKAPACYD